MRQIAYTIEHHAKRYDSVMVIVAIPSPLNTTYIRPPSGQSNHKADRDIAHHTSHHTHLSIHPIPPKKKKKKKAITVTVSHSPAEQGKKKPTGKVTRIPSPHVSLQAEKHRSPGHDTDRRLDIPEQSKNAKRGCLHTYIYTYIHTYFHTYTRRYVEKTNMPFYPLTSILTNQHIQSSSPK